MVRSSAVFPQNNQFAGEELGQIPGHDHVLWPDPIEFKVYNVAVDVEQLLCPDVCALL